MVGQHNKWLNLIKTPGAKKSKFLKTAKKRYPSIKVTNGVITKPDGQELHMVFATALWKAILISTNMPRAVGREIFN